MRITTSIIEVNDIQALIQDLRKSYSNDKIEIGTKAIRIKKEGIARPVYIAVNKSNNLWSISYTENNENSSKELF